MVAEDPILPIDILVTFKYFSIFLAFAFPVIGKKWSLIGLVFPFIGGWVILLLSSNYAMLLVCRFLTVFSGGAFVLAAPAYTAR